MGLTDGVIRRRRRQCCCCCCSYASQSSVGITKRRNINLKRKRAQRLVGRNKSAISRPTARAFARTIRCLDLIRDTARNYRVSLYSSIEEGVTEGRDTAEEEKKVRKKGREKIKLAISYSKCGGSYARNAGRASAAYKIKR